MAYGRWWVARTRSAVGSGGLVTVASLAAIVAAPGMASADFACFQRGADFGDEIVPTGFRVLSRVDEAGGVTLVEIAADVTNEDVGDFRGGTATPDLASAGLDLDAEAVVAPLAFDALSPRGRTAASAALRLRIPTDDVDAFVDALDDGRVPFVVHADERTHLATDVTVRPWVSTETWLPSGGLNFFPQPLPFEPGTPTGRYYLVEDPAVHVPPTLPAALRNVRVIEFIEPRLPGEPFTIDFEPVEDELLADLVRTGSFCTSEAALIDPVIQATRVGEIDGREIEGADRNGQPIRFNDVEVATGVTVSGSLGGHVLRPVLQVRVREGRVVFRLAFESELSFTAQVRAQASLTLERREADLFSLCFPMPPIVAGALNIPVWLRVDHGVYVEGEAFAGLEAGLRQTLRSETSFVYDPGAPAGERLESSSRRLSSPLELTPPRLTDDTRAELVAGTTIRTSVVLSQECLATAGAYAELDVHATVAVDPDADPWWSLGVDADVRAGLDVDLFGIDVAEVSVPIPLPRLGAREAPAGETPAPVGDDQRWAVSIDDLDAMSVMEDETRIAVDPDGGLVLTGHALVTDENAMVALDRFGAHRWNASFGIGYEPIAPRYPADGGPLHVGGRTANGPWLAVFEPDAEPLWANLYRAHLPGDPNRKCVPYGFALVPEARGGGAIFVGDLGRPVITANDGCAVRVDEDGDVLWARIYEGEGRQQLRGVVSLADGGFAFSGATDWDEDPNFTTNPLLLRVDADGQLVWTRVFQIRRGGFARAVVEREDGTLFWAGDAPGSVTSTGAFMVGRVAGDGSGVLHALLFQNEAFEAELGDAVDTPGGDTPWDVAYDLGLVEGGVVVVGRTGLEYPGVGFHEDASAWVLQINDALGVEWMVALDGLFEDQLTSIVVDDDGLWVGGTSKSFVPFGEGGERNVLFAAKLPHEGFVSFLDETGAASRYLAPGVRASSLDERVVVPGSEAIVQAITVSDAQVTVEDVIAGVLRARSPVCVTLLTESGRASATDDCGRDSDGDGVDDADDVCRFDADPDQDDTDGDGRGDACDGDDDGDRVPDGDDGCPLDPAKTAPGACGCGVPEADCTGGDGGPPGPGGPDGGVRPRPRGDDAGGCGVVGGRPATVGWSGVLVLVALGAARRRRAPRGPTPCRRSAAARGGAPRRPRDEAGRR